MISEAMNYDFDQAKEFMTRLEAEVAANVHLTEEHRALLIGAVSLGSAILLEGVPGTGKTHTAKTIAAAMGGDFQRIQGTPDTLPADIRGTRIYNPSLEGNFEFEEGPVFANVLLLD